ncbi:sterol desaturase family protein [Microbulbifer sp. OS29]|uniref:Sterol desaturase family protein n=1 Tax=Microbulbifer okhotskensis TaxID=2926617 RepID=A0A9X2EJI0_9GAMM|nr:sterol desaturase family protein [Microbulbifer okhotskensis]MCO1332846.1 sterol desaturase family protein [Microbulbifer okhotskensis]
MNLITLAIPFFLFAILLEVILDRWKGWGLYRLNDAIGNLSTGILSRIIGLTYKSLFLVIYIPLFALLQPYYQLVGFHWSIDNGWHLALAVLAYDFCYYWKHRICHEVNIFWAEHLVHHQSEDYNLTTALRQSSGGLQLNWIFYLPLLLIGLPAEIVIAAGAIDLIYQFWVHTQKIPKIRWLEWFLITPSNHRVHHAQNRVYVDKNYGGILIIWDRLFGTYQPELEDEPCLYGVRKPLNTFDPVAANFQHLKRMALDAWHTKNWWDKFTLWFRPTGYRPADAESAMPVTSTNLANFKRFNPEISRGLRNYAFIQHFCYSAATLSLLWLNSQLSFWQLLGTVTTLIFCLAINGRILDGHPKSYYLESARLAALACAIPLLSNMFVPLFVSYLIASALVWWWLASKRKEDKVTFVSD